MNDFHCDVQQKPGFRVANPFTSDHQLFDFFVINHKKSTLMLASEKRHDRIAERFIGLRHETDPNPGQKMGLLRP